MRNYLRRDEDPESIRPLRLISRQFLTCAADMTAAVRDWGPGTGLALSRVLLRYHWMMTTGARANSRPVTLRVARRGRHITCVLRADPSDLFVLREVFIQNVYRFPYERFLGNVTRVLDIGSNIGMSALYFALYFPQAEIICVEPVSANATMLTRNRDVNKYRWTIIEAPVAATEGTTTLYTSHWWASSSTCKAVVDARRMQRHRPENRLPLTETTGVATVTISSLLDSSNWETVDILKIDIEGAEADLFLGANTAWLDRVRVLVLDIHGKYVPREGIIERLAQHGFRAASENGPHSAVFLSRQVLEAKRHPGGTRVRH